MADGPRAHPHARHRAVGDVERVGAGLGQHLGRRQQTVGRKPARRIDFDRDDEIAPLQPLRQPRRRLGHLRRQRVRRFAHRDNPGRVGLRRIQGLAHGGDVVGRRTAAAADDGCAHGAEEAGVLPEVIRRGGIHDPAAESFGPAGVGHHGQRPAGRARLHLLEDPQQLGRPAGAVGADDVGAGDRQRRRHLGRAVAQQAAIVAGVGHRGQDRQIAHLARRFHGQDQLAQVGVGLEDQQVDSGIDQGGNRAPVGGDRLFRADASVRRQSDAERAEAAADPHRLARLDGLTRQADGGPDDLLQAVLQAVRRQLVRVGPEGVRLEDFGAGPQVAKMDVDHELGPGAAQVVETGADRQTAGMQHRSHGPVGESRPAGRQPGGKAIAFRGRSRNGHPVPIREEKRLSRRKRR